MSYSSKVEISSCNIEAFTLKIEFKFSKIEFFFTILRRHLWVYSSKIGRQVYTKERETRPGPVISLNLGMAPLHSLQESKYPRV